MKLGGRSTEPAGGAALALAGASAAALMSLTCHSGLRAIAEGDTAVVLDSCQRDSEELARRMQHLVDADVTAYRRVTAALRAAHGTEEERARRTERLDEALQAATDVPLSVADVGLGVLELASQVSAVVAGPVLGDLTAAVHLAEAAIKGSLRNAHINAAAMSDGNASRAAEARIADFRARLDDRTREIDAALRRRGAAG